MTDLSFVAELGERTVKVFLDARPTLGGIHRYTTELCRILPEGLKQTQFDIFRQSPGLGRQVGPAGTGRPLPLISLLRQMVTDQILVPLAIQRSSAQLFQAPYGFLPKRLGLCSVVTCHDLWLLEGLATKPRGFKKYYDKWNFTRALQRADQILTLSHTVAAKLRTLCGFDSQRVTCIPPPLPTLTADPREPVPPRPFLLTVGTLEPRKNFERLLEAQALAFSKTKVPLYLVGPYGWRVKSILARLDRIEPAAKWLGRVAESTLALLYKNASALVQYSLDEGFDYPVAEALGFGCPLVLSDIPVHRELAGNLGLFASPYEPAQLAWRIEEVLSWSSLLREEHGARAKTVIAELKAQGRPERYLEVYRKALA